MSVLVIDYGKDHIFMLIDDSLSDFVCSYLSDENKIVISSDGISSCGNPPYGTKYSSSTFTHVHSFVRESVNRMVAFGEQYPVDGIGIEVNIKSPVVVMSVEIRNGECLCLALQIVELDHIVCTQSDHDLSLRIQ